jgi:GTP-binding protein Era
MPELKCGAVALVGRPNAGKSTLLNAFLGEKLAIVSPRPQTTRGAMAGVHQDEDAQVVFYDTPGMHQPRNELGHFMLRQVQEVLDGSDLALFLVDAGEGVGEEEELAAEWLRKWRKPVLVVLNKTDLLSHPKRLALGPPLKALGRWPLFEAQAAKGTGVPGILAAVKERLPVRPPLFPEDEWTDRTVRDLAAELVREQCFLQLKQEVPYGVAVVIEEFKEPDPPDPVVVTATLYVERDAHKGIVIGAGGRQLKALGQAAREGIERLLDRKVFLQLWVKTLKNWRKDPRKLKRLGYADG